MKAFFLCFWWISFGGVVINKLALAILTKIVLFSSIMTIFIDIYRLTVRANHRGPLESYAFQSYHGCATPENW